MNLNQRLEDSRASIRDSWQAVVARYQVPAQWRATWQIVNSVGGYLVLWGLMAWAVTVSWWLAIPIAILAGALAVRVFIIHHDCGHGSFFASRKANDFWGGVTGVLTFTPYLAWRGQHAIHHGSAGNLDKRGVGDVWTMTVSEYLAAPRMQRIKYRLARNPIVLLFIAPIAMFVFEQRIPKSDARPREVRSVWRTNVVLLIQVVGMSLLLGFGTYVILQLTVLAVAGAIGIWLFYLQHQFEDAYWEHGENWDYTDAALDGSGFLRLPKVLQWFTGNIGYHHIHHLNARIPNYNLQACHESHEAFRQVKAMTLSATVRALRLNLWCEANKRLVRFAQIRHLPRTMA